MATWWYYKPVPQADIEIQEAAAKTGSDGTGIVTDSYYWVGMSRNARYQNCQSVESLIFDRQDALMGRPEGPRPIVKGDHVWVYSTLCLGRTAKKIRAVIREFHKSQIHLHIYTAGYHDDLSASSMYYVIDAVLSDLETGSQVRSAAQRAAEFKRRRLVTQGDDEEMGSGRPPLDISYLSLAPSGMKILRKYCTDKKIRRQDCFDDLNRPGAGCLGKTPDGKPVTSIGKNTFQRLVQECCDALEKDGIRTVRRRKK